MTHKGRDSTGQIYSPMVSEGNKILARLHVEDLAVLRDFLLAARQLTDRYRQQLRG
jgi:hypothetical protein